MKLSYNPDATVKSQLQAFINLDMYARGQSKLPPDTSPLTPDLSKPILERALGDGDLALWASMFGESLSAYQGLLDDLATGKRKEADIKRSMIREALVGLSICV